MIKVIYFGFEQSFEKKLKDIDNRSIIANIFRIKSDDSIMCLYFYPGFIDLMLSNESLTDFASRFSPNNSKENNKKMVEYFEFYRSGIAKQWEIYINLVH